MENLQLTINASLVAVLAGAIASVSGFGIGSLLTPVVSLGAGTKLAVAIVAIPHFVATALRCFMLRKDIDRKVLVSFGITSALGGLSGALMHNYLQTTTLTFVFACILIFAGLMGLTNWLNLLYLKGWSSFLAGGLSGFLGGVVGNQGGIRSAALFGFDLSPRVFVATATAIGVAVDLARLPVYLVAEYKEITTYWLLTLILCVAVTIGTLAGTVILKRMNETLFKRVVSAAILALGIFLLIKT
ncbi:MAG: sulfite exporter TauE/SafE family protein [Candidatus Obscuribacterales bacterium]|nr:sulfite exporter TauE/SafE family protein [Candidatus Obscuribacterales bacterium]